MKAVADIDAWLEEPGRRCSDICHFWLFRPMVFRIRASSPLGGFKGISPLFRVFLPSVKGAAGAHA